MARQMWELPRTNMTSNEINALLQGARDAGMPIRWKWSEIYTTGGLRPSVIVTLTPAGVNEHAYDVFLDMRTDLGGWMQKTARSKLIDVGTQRDWASFKVVLALPENPTSNIAGEVDPSGARDRMARKTRRSGRVYGVGRAVRGLRGAVAHIDGEWWDAGVYDARSNLVNQCGHGGHDTRREAEACARELLEQLTS